MKACNDDMNLCPKFSKTFEILGRKWNGLIIEVLLKDGPQRFKDISHKISKCSDRVLVERLRELEREGLVEHQISTSVRSIYQLTKQGRDLEKVMYAIHVWADKWYATMECHHDE